MTLETERLILRPWCEDDAKALYEYASDARVGPAAGWPVHTSEENSREIIKTVLGAPETYALVLKSENKPVGSVGLLFRENSNIKLTDTEAEIGYWLGVPYWGQGLMPEAVRRIQHHAFEDLNLTALWCGYFDGNIKSKRAQEKCGFVYQYTEKDILWELTNEIKTEHITRLTRDEWASR